MAIDDYRCINDKPNNSPSYVTKLPSNSLGRHLLAPISSRCTEVPGWTAPFQEPASPEGLQGLRKEGPRAEELREIRQLATFTNQIAWDLAGLKLEYLSTKSWEKSENGPCLTTKIGICAVQQGLTDKESNWPKIVTNAYGGCPGCFPADPLDALRSIGICMFTAQHHTDPDLRVGYIFPLYTHWLVYICLSDRQSHRLTFDVPFFFAGFFNTCL